MHRQNLFRDPVVESGEVASHDRVLARSRLSRHLEDWRRVSATRDYARGSRVGEYRPLRMMTKMEAGSVRQRSARRDNCVSDLEMA